MKTLLSTRDVANLLRVTETTIKRWTAGGKLSCVKTPGGHRRYRMMEVLRFAGEQAYPVSGIHPAASPSADFDTLEFSMYRRDFAPVAALLLESALKGERARILEILTYLTKRQVGMAAIGDEIIRPVLSSIGRQWTDGMLEINQEHIASQALLEAVIRLSPELPRKPSNGLTAVCAGAEGDQHEIGLRLLCYVLEGEGWTVHYLGANTPFDTLRSYIAGTRPGLLCLSTTVRRTEATTADLRALGAHARSIGTVFLVGGASAAELSAEDLACDAIIASASDAVEFLRTRFHAGPARGPRPSAAAAEGGTQ